jgi:hypothetical protein
MRLTASVRQARAKDRYERAQNAFQKIETECKAHEVRVGRVVDFGDQLRLLKAYETSEQARGRWFRAARRLEARKAREAWLKQLNGRKLPYTFGLVDNGGRLLRRRPHRHGGVGRARVGRTADDTAVRQ